MNDALSQAKTSLTQFFRQYPSADDFMKNVARSFPQIPKQRKVSFGGGVQNPFVSWGSRGNTVNYQTANPKDEDTFKQSTKSLWDVLDYKLKLI